MKLAEQDTITALDEDFGKMAVAVGRHAWGLTALSMREKAFVFIAADLSIGCLGFPLRAHVDMARSHDVPISALREAVRHLAPYVSYPRAAEALGVLSDQTADEAVDEVPAPGNPVSGRLDAAISDRLRAADLDFFNFLNDQMSQRWDRPGLTPRERALATLATDVCLGTLDDSFSVHVGLAREYGASEEQIRTVLLLVAEYGVAKSWRAYSALTRITQ